MMITKDDIVGEIQNIQTIAVGNSIRRLDYLNRKYGKGRWRKLKGIAYVRNEFGGIDKVDLHWYEAHGIGRVDFKAKQYLD
jgi:hypothetical protein